MSQTGWPIINVQGFTKAESQGVTVWSNSLKLDREEGGKHHSLSQSLDLAKLSPNCHMNYSNYL